MIELGPYAGYIVAAYAGVVLLVIGLITWVVWDARQVAARLQQLEDRGVRRRSAGPAA
jgi:heme exporter protein D